MFISDVESNAGYLPRPVATFRNFDGLKISSVMNDALNRNNLIAISLMILAVAMVRFIAIPWPNFAPIGAMALFGAACMRYKLLGFVVPLAALFVTDLFIGFHNTMPFVYGGFILVGLIGLLIRGRIKTGSLVLAGLASSIIFFLVSNFGVWAISPMPKNLGTLMLTYQMGLPFFHYTLLGDFVFISALFGAWYLLKQRVSMLESA